MGLITKQLLLEGDKGKAGVEALFDTGASASFIRREVAKNVGTVVKLPTPWTFVPRGW